ncbi:ATP-dependent sacrificial sulfur transferase LarE [Methanolobus sp. ZRKC3]|uniref:ATP-dependent sacrificial sulfur transferase LarE n=1 Tax=Methanolobus sp. ZRKC3 TaxID=3125786 RepID=UPI003244FC7C
MLDAKTRELKKAIAGVESAVVAFSGGVDSATLAYLAHDTLGDNAVAVTVKNRSYPIRELDLAKKLAEEIGIRHIVVDFDELLIPSISSNTAQRCYHCKKEILGLLKSVMGELGFKKVLEGSNASDANSYRPGGQALLEAKDYVYSPFKDLGVSKDEVRQIARDAGISAADKPSSPCLASRFPYNDPLTAEALKRVEIAEDYLIELGFLELRVRDHKGLARIEIPPADFQRFLDLKGDISSYFRKIGFEYVTLDIQGLRSGSMDEVL